MIMAQKEQSVSWKTKAEDKEKKNLQGSGRSKMGIQVCFIPKIYKSRHELRLKYTTPIQMDQTLLLGEISNLLHSSLPSLVSS